MAFITSWSAILTDFFLKKKKQDEGLDIISEGLDTLKNLAHDMNEVGCAFENSIMQMLEFYIIITTLFGGLNSGNGSASSINGWNWYKGIKNVFSSVLLCLIDCYKK